MRYWTFEEDPDEEELKEITTNLIVIRDHLTEATITLDMDGQEATVDNATGVMQDIVNMAITLCCRIHFARLEIEREEGENG